MMYQDWDLELKGEHICITAFDEKDEEAYGRLLLGELYDKLLKYTDPIPTGFNTIIDHTSEDEIHAIRLHPDGSPIGWIALQKKNDHPDIGITLHKDQQNKGYGPEAIQLYCNYLSETYGLQQVHTRISDKNMQCRNAFAKVGAVFDSEETDERYTSLLENYPEHKMAEGFMMKMRHYHIPLPISEILPGTHPDPETIRKAQEAYDAQEAQYINEITSSELELIEKKAESKKDASADEIKSMIKDRIDELNQPGSLQSR